MQVFPRYPAIPNFTTGSNYVLPYIFVCNFRKDVSHCSTLYMNRRIHHAAQDNTVSDFSKVIPDDWLATGSNPARYQIELESEDVTVLSCPYTDGHTLYLKNNNITATIIDMEDNSVIAQEIFYGKYEDAALTCPDTYTFYYLTAEKRVGRPDPTEFEPWLTPIMEPLGFSFSP